MHVGHVTCKRNRKRSVSHESQGTEVATASPCQIISSGLWVLRFHTYSVCRCVYSIRVCSQIKVHGLPTLSCYSHLRPTLIPVTPWTCTTLPASTSVSLPSPSVDHSGAVGEPMQGTPYTLEERHRHRCEDLFAYCASPKRHWAFCPLRLGNGQTR